MILFAVYEMLAFGFFFIALGLNPFSRRYENDDDLNPTEPDIMAKEEKPPAEGRGIFPKLADRFFGDQGDKAALKEKDGSLSQV